MPNRLPAEPTTPSPPPPPLAREHMKRRMAEREVEDLVRHNNALRAHLWNQEREFEAANDSLRAANFEVRRLDQENRMLKALEAEYQKSSAEFIKTNAEQEIRLKWAEKELEVVKAQAAELYDEKARAEALVAEAMHQGFRST